MTNYTHSKKPLQYCKVKKDYTYSTYSAMYHNADTKLISKHIFKIHQWLPSLHKVPYTINNIQSHLTGAELNFGK